MTTVAVLADIHGVLPVLEAVLGEQDVQAADVIVLAGDIASWPQPVATIGLLTALGERAALESRTAHLVPVGPSSIQTAYNCAELRWTASRQRTGSSASRRTQGARSGSRSTCCRTTPTRRRWRRSGRVLRAERLLLWSVR